MIYLDHAAATPLSPKVLAAMKPYLTDRFFNASAGYLAAKAVKKDIEDARAKVAAILGARPGEIIFTTGGTESNNLAVQGVMQAHPDANLVISSLEHDSVLEPARQYKNQEISALASGLIDAAAVQNMIDDKTVLVSVMYVNNEIGTIQPLSKIANIIRAVRAERERKGNKLPIYFHTDACQAGNYLHLLVDKLGVDLMTINAGKLYGPKQAGALYQRVGTVMKSQILGGGQERNMRSGTESPANIIGFAEALSEAQKNRQAESERLKDLRRLFILKLQKAVAEVRVTAPSKHTIPNNVHVTITGQDNERLMMQLDEAGVICAVGSACSASNDEPSHVLKALGLNDSEARSSLRFTMGRSTTAQEIEKTVDMLAKIVV
jgi:cysteine desulfurase